MALTAATIIVLFVLGTQSPGALVGYGLIAFAAYTTLTEFYRGTRARMSKGENPLTALWKLFGRNRRRYGGYFIHLGIVVIGIGVICSTAYHHQKKQNNNPGEKITLGNPTDLYKHPFQGPSDCGQAVRTST